MKKFEKSFSDIWYITVTQKSPDKYPKRCVDFDWFRQFYFDLYSMLYSKRLSTYQHALSVYHT